MQHTAEVLNACAHPRDAKADSPAMWRHASPVILDPQEEPRRSNFEDHVRASCRCVPVHIRETLLRYAQQSNAHI